MTPEKFSAPRSPEEQQTRLATHPRDGLNRNRLLAMIAIVLMLLIAASFGYRLQIGPFGLTFERTQSGEASKVPMPKS